MSHFTAFSVTMDAADPAAQARFWAEALGYAPEPPPPPHETWEETLISWGLPEEQWNDAAAIVDPAGIGPRVFIQKVPEPKSAKNRVHLDVRVSRDRENKDRDRMRATADELVAKGATLVRIVDDSPMGFWIVMSDPEGNEFCLV